ncbi:unnamed protein product [Coccothraustes coccothraustes]
MKTIQSLQLYVHEAHPQSLCCSPFRRAGAPLLGRQAERAEVVQPGEKEPLGRPKTTFQYLNGAYKRVGEGCFTMK